MGKSAAKVLTVALNPAIDRGIEISSFKIGAHQVGRQLFRRAAGKGVNVARVLNTLKVPSAITGFVGRGQQAYFERQLTGEYVSCELFSVAGQTRENITIVDPVSKVDTHIRDHGFQVDASDLEKLRKKLALVAREDVTVCFSGSLPDGVDLTDFMTLVHICRMGGSRVCVDSGGAVLRSCGSGRLYVIKPNFDELSEMLERPITGRQNVLDVADRLGEMVDVALITCGAEGAYVVSDGAVLYGKVPVDPNEVTNTVGCGDAMLAGFLAADLAGKDRSESCRYALAVATSAAVSLAPGEVHRQDIERFYEQATVERCAPG